MFKLQFARCSEPKAPSWAAGRGPNPFAHRSDSPALADCWDWLSGCAGATVTGGGAECVDDLVRSFSFQWLIKAPVPVDVCQDGVRTKETIQFSFPQTTTVCEFGVGINLGKKNSFTQAVRTQSQKMILPDGAKICELKVNFPKQSYKYDDAMALTWNGLTLLTNRVQMLNSNKEFNFLNIRGQQFTDHTPFCFGQESGSQCTLPQTDRSGDIELKLSETAIQELITRFGEEPQHDVSVHVTGDNDNSDCQHKGFGFTVEVTYGE